MTPPAQRLLTERTVCLRREGVACVVEAALKLTFRMRPSFPRHPGSGARLRGRRPWQESGRRATATSYEINLAGCWHLTVCRATCGLLMTSPLHEAPLSALRQFPELLLHLARELFDAPLPADSRVREVTASFTEAAIQEYRADAVFLIESVLRRDADSVNAGQTARAGRWN